MSQKNSGFERKDGDEYMTPEWVAEALLTVERFCGRVWEPACGEGAIARVLSTKRGYGNLTATDINPAYSQGQSIDFLTADLVRDTDWPLMICTNPPYGKNGKLAVAFVERALELTKPSYGKGCMLLPHGWDAAPGRKHLFADFPAYVAIHCITKRIRWTNLPQSAAGPSVHHAWFVWDWARTGRGIGWL